MNILKNHNLSKTPKSLVKIIEYNDERIVFVDNEQLDMNVCDDVFEVSIEHLKKMRVSDLQDPVAFRYDGCGETQFNLATAIEFRFENSPVIDIEIVLINKYWEGFFGLTTYLEAISDQVNRSDRYEITYSELEDVQKQIWIRHRISRDQSLYDSLISAAEEFNQLVRQAEQALAKKARKRY